MSARVEVNWNNIKIYMNDVIHVVIKKDELIGIQSWIEGYGNDSTYHIRYYVRNKNNINSEYWDVQHWQDVLNALDQHDLFSLST